jgi:hypothetical protein
MKQGFGPPANFSLDLGEIVIQDKLAIKLGVGIGDTLGAR